MDDRLSPVGQPNANTLWTFEMSNPHALPNSPPHRDRTHPQYHHPTHTSARRAGYSPQITPHIEQQNPIWGATTYPVGCPLGF
jgi:hypothetical protein